MPGKKPVRPLIDNGDGTLSVTLTRGQVAIIDACDRDKVAVCNWWAQRNESHHTYYAHGRPIGRAPVYMHRWILGSPKGLVDHADGNGLRNFRANLRVATHTENMQNQRRNRGRVRFRGVYQKRSVYGACIRVHKKRIYLGCFSTPIEAALAYDAAAIQHYGEFAATNAALGLLQAEAV